MNRKIAVILSAIVLTFMLAGCARGPEVMESVTAPKVTTAQNTTIIETTQASVEETTQTSVVETTAQTQEPTNNFIGEDRAIEIALERIPGASKSDVRIHLDRDDGIDMYEGSVVYNEMEYDFEIDARTGTILEWDSESIYD